MRLDPHISFSGQCEAAFKFYEKCFGGKIQYLKRYDETPMGEGMPADWGRKIIHSTFKMGDRILMGSDAPADRYRKPQGFTLSIEAKNPAEADRVFGDLSVNGQIQMPMQETFWAERFGMVVDQFDIPWMVNCSKSGQT